MAWQKKVLALTAVAALGTGLWYGLGFWEASRAVKPSIAWGTVDAREADLAFETSGRIKALFKEEGEAVKVGERLGELDTRLLEIEYAAAKAELDGKEADLRLAMDGYRDEEIAAAKASLAAIESELALARRTEARLSKLRKADAASVQAYDDAKSNREMLEGNRDKAAADYLRLSSGLRSDEVKKAQAARDAAEAALAMLDYQIKTASIITSPATGVIRSRLAEVGDMAASSKVVYQIAVMDPKWVRAFVSETQLGFVKEGGHALVYTDTTAPVEATVGYISPEAEFTPKNVATNELRTMLVYEVRLNVKDPTNTLRLGQPVTVDFAPHREKAELLKNDRP